MVKLSVQLDFPELFRMIYNPDHFEYLFLLTDLILNEINVVIRVANEFLKNSKLIEIYAHI
jgi:hypothetical protein